MIIDTLMNKLGFDRKLIAQRNKPVELSSAFTTWNQEDEDPVPSNLNNHVRLGFSGNSVVYACLSEKANAASFANIRIYKGDKNNFEELDATDPFAKLFVKPNPYFAWVEFQQLINLYLDLDGNAYIYKYKENTNQNDIDGLYLLRPDKVTPVIKSGEELLGYLYKPDPNKDPEPFLTSEIIHLKYPNPLDANNGLGRGVSPLASVLEIIRLDNQNTSFLNTFFKNAAVPFGLLKTKERLADPEVARIRERIKKQYAGSLNWHEIMILDTDAEYQRLGLDLKELEFSALDNRNEARICSALRVPPQIIGARVGLEHSTYSNYEEARKGFWEDKLVPFYLQLQSGFNKGFYDDFDGNVWIEYDFSEVPALKSQENAKFERTLRAFTAGLFTHNEAREAIGYEPLENILEEPKELVESEEIIKTLKYSTILFEPKSKRIVLNTDENDQARDELEQRHKRLISTALRKQLKSVVDILPDENQTQDDISKALEELENQRHILKDAIERMLTEGVLFGARYGLDVIEEFLGVNQKFLYNPYLTKQFEIGTWDLVNEAALAWVQDYSFDLVSGLTATSEAQLTTALNTWISNGLNKTELTRSLTGTFGSVRAEMIAVTETTRSYAEGNIRAWRETGVATHIIWKTTNDERVCPICSSLGGIRMDNSGNPQPASIDEQNQRGVISSLENNEFVHPGGNGPQKAFEGELFNNPPAHPRCRCFLSVAIL